MKRFLFALLLATFALAAALPGQEPLKTDDSREVVTRSYELKHVTPRDAASALKSYVFQASYNDSSSLLTVTLPRGNLAAFEENLKRIDVEKRAIQFRVFTVIATSQGESGPIENRDLKGVLDELQKLLSFRAYRLDGASVITAREGGDASLQLPSSVSGLLLELMRIRVESGPPPTIQFGLRFRGREGERLDLLLESEHVSLREKGYLVAGVSKLGKNGDSLVLVINAEIKK